MSDILFDINIKYTVLYLFTQVIRHPASIYSARRFLIRVVSQVNLYFMWTTLHFGQHSLAVQAQQHSSETPEDSVALSVAVVSV